MEEHKYTAGPVSPLCLQDHQVSVRQAALPVRSGHQQPPACGVLRASHLRDGHQAVRQVAHTALPRPRLLCTLHHLEAGGSAGEPGGGGGLGDGGGGALPGYNPLHLHSREGGGAQCPGADDIGL